MKSNKAWKAIILMQETYLDVFDKEIAAELTAQSIRVAYFAEQDAEERAVEAFRRWFTSRPSAIENIAIAEFKEFYNNGGQSNE